LIEQHSGETKVLRESTGVRSSWDIRDFSETGWVIKVVLQDFVISTVSGKISTGNGLTGQPLDFFND
jgi:hypothetical protein